MSAILAAENDTPYALINATTEKLLMPPFDRLSSVKKTVSIRMVGVRTLDSEPDAAAVPPAIAPVSGTRTARTIRAARGPITPAATSAPRIPITETSRSMMAGATAPPR